MNKDELKCGRDESVIKPTTTTTTTESPVTKPPVGSSSENYFKIISNGMRNFTANIYFL
jgi:hypothetical protein